MRQPEEARWSSLRVRVPASYQNAVCVGASVGIRRKQAPRHCVKPLKLTIMSGGRFDYLQYRFKEIIDQIEDEVFNDTGYSKETEAEFMKAVELLKLTQVYVHRIDLLLSGDDGEENFHERLKRDLAELSLRDFQGPC